MSFDRSVQHDFILTYAVFESLRLDLQLEAQSRGQAFAARASYSGAASQRRPTTD